MGRTHYIIGQKDWEVGANYTLGWLRQHKLLAGRVKAPVAARNNAARSSPQMLFTSFHPSSDPGQPWWLVFLVGLGILLLIWSVRNRLNRSFGGLPGCTGEVTAMLGTVFGFILMIVGIVGIFYPRILLWLDRGLFVFENLVLAWELIFGVIFLALILYFIVAARTRLKGLGCGSIILLILAADYIYFIIASDRWRAMVEPLENLFRLFRGG